MFIEEDKTFISDREKERFIVTHNPCGFLRKT
jgi:hypothetical protein